MTNSKLPTNAYRGARDIYPDEMFLQNYIYDTWKKVCKLYGFEQYDFPIIESFDVFAAKTGEEIVKTQLFSFEDQAGRKLAIRPELTPGTVRMIAAKYNELPKPIKWFMIGNNWRYERPQKGRGREFNQLEVNIFGVQDVSADFEIFSLMIAIMLAFGADNQKFEILVNDRRLINQLLYEVLKLDDNKALRVRTTMDGYKKFSEDEFTEKLSAAGLTNSQANTLKTFMNVEFGNLGQIFGNELLQSNKGYTSLKKLFELLADNDLIQFCRFDSSIVRGFDYSDGIVYEVFDKNPLNKRSMFGGERFDKLINIFGDYEMPATGFAMGDWTLIEFLTGWDLLPKTKTSADVFVTTWPEETPSNTGFLSKSNNIARELRENGKLVFLWTDTSTKLEKQLKYANTKGIKYVVITGPDEIANNKVTLKNMLTKEQKTCSFEEMLNDIK